MSTEGLRPRLQVPAPAAACFPCRGRARTSGPFAALLRFRPAGALAVQPSFPRDAGQCAGHRLPLLPALARQVASY